MSVLSRVVPWVCCDNCVIIVWLTLAVFRPNLLIILGSKFGTGSVYYLEMEDGQLVEGRVGSHGGHAIRCIVKETTTKKQFRIRHECKDDTI